MSKYEHILYMYIHGLTRGNVTMTPVV